MKLDTLGLLGLLAYVIYKSDKRLAWERKHHEEAVQRWRKERETLRSSSAVQVHTLPPPEYTLGTGNTWSSQVPPPVNTGIYRD